MWVERKDVKNIHSVGILMVVDQIMVGNAAAWPRHPGFKTHLPTKILKGYLVICSVLLRKRTELRNSIKP